MNRLGSEPVRHEPHGPVIQLELPLLLPEAVGDQDVCIARLLRLMQRRRGVRHAHVERTTGSAALCLHYDPEVLPLDQVEALARAAGTAITARFGHVVLPFQSVGSEDSGRRFEMELRTMPGVRAASVNFAAQLARVEFDRRRVDEQRIARSLSERAAARRPTIPPRSWYARNRALAWSLTSGVFLLLGAVATRLEEVPALAVTALFAVAYVFGARDNVGHFIADLRRGRFHFNIDLLMVVAAVGAALLGEWFEGALLLFLFSLGHALEHYALGRARHAIAALAELAPQTARVVRDGTEAIVPIVEVQRGDRVVVWPAERIPVDGIVREGHSGVNQAPITGESVPVDKAADDTVFAGSVNGEGALVVEVTAAVGDRTLDRVIKLVSEAQTQKAPTQQFTDRFARIFVPAVLVADALLIVVPPLLGVWTWSESFYRAMALLVAASPCALALGTPAAVLSGIAQAARNGVLIKGGAHLESLGAVHTLALDKTGTITLGEPCVTDLRPATGVSEELLLQTAASIERRSQHPLARAVVREAEARALAVPAADDATAVTGRGMRGVVEGVRVEVGRLLLFDDAQVAVPDTIRDAVSTLERAGRSTLVVRRAEAASTGVAPEIEWLGVIGVADQPRPGARGTLALLRRMGIQRIVMLTGDNAGAGNAVAAQIGVTEVHAGLLAADKVSVIQELAKRGPVAMVGDGVNDAPALAHAAVGVAMGGAGSAAALETADVALMGDDLSRLPFAIGISRAARRVIRQNVAISLAVIASLVVATLVGALGIGPAVALHEGSTLVVVANALRLLSYRSPGRAR
ncbi:MAG: cadmium-translocating P-type ATPase [Gemmatimonas sp.]|nr:cadmium-translocating P-type ATPase [Gemmatimonas sp.]